MLAFQVATILLALLHANQFATIVAIGTWTILPSLRGTQR